MGFKSTKAKVSYKCRECENTQLSSPFRKCEVCGSRTDVICSKCGPVLMIGGHKHCPECDSAPGKHYVVNYDIMWKDGDVYCSDCGAYVRMYDAG